MALWLGFIEVGIEWFWGILVKEKDYWFVVLFFMGLFEFLSWRVSGIDRLKMALLYGFYNVNTPRITCIFVIDTSYTVL